MSDRKELGYQEATGWTWECPDCEWENRLEINDIEWDDTTPVIECQRCEKHYEFTFKPE